MRCDPLQIGPVRLATNLLLAPVAGYCDLAFRTVCREQGGVGLACTDLLSPQGLLRGTAASLDLAQTSAFDRPVGMQLYGSDPTIMADGAQWAVAHGAGVIDINMGCPVDKVTKKDGGSKLLTDLPRAIAIVRAVARRLDGSGVPLTCKIRLCWHDRDFAAGRACSPGLAAALADEGVAAVTVHGRTTEQKFTGSVRLEGIARVVEAVRGRIPVIGNGDVRTPDDAERMVRQTGVQGVMIGRGAFSAPWLFRDVWARLSGAGAAAAPPDLSEEGKVGVVRRYFALMRQYRDDHYAMHHIRRRISWFGKSLSGGACRPLREAVRLAETPDDVEAALQAHLTGALRAPEPVPGGPALRLPRRSVPSPVS
ncbi:MAG: tRNA-dihydrouridine synthase [Phycisphaerales bacterium]|nr:tRNA-dihydrouridine synthase [Phycisphaerales bacterium]